MLNEILNEISREHSIKDSEAAQHKAKEAKKAEEAEELLNYLRLNIKYVLFDLESTRRENKYLRNLLEQDD